MENLVKDFEMNSSLEKVLSFCVFMSLFFLALGALTSISILSLSHVFIILPALYFIPKANYKNYPKSAWALLAFAIVLVLSIVVNQDIIANGYKNISKTKYFFIGFLSIAPLSWYFRKHLTEKKLSVLLYALLIAATVSTLSGVIGKFTGMNPLTGKAPLILDRNSGMMGMVMNYAHNLSFVLVLTLGLILNKVEIEKIINFKLLIIMFVINLIGFYFSYTRGAWLGFLVGVPFLFVSVLGRKKFSILALGLVTLLSVAYFSSGESVKRVDGDLTRVGLWQASIEAFKERPFLGYGYLNFEPHSVELKTKHNFPYPNFSGQAHSNLFEILATSGLLGIGTFICFLGFCLKEFLKAPFALSFLFCFLVGGLTQSTISLGINIFLILGCYLLSVLHIQNTKAEE